MDFTNAQKLAPNPWVRALGYLNDETLSTFYGLGIIGAMNPARANTSGEGEAEQEGYTECLTEVVPWPYDEDSAGIAFDKDNLYGVRTRVWRQTIADGGGDKEWYVPVPKMLPDGYTEVGRCGIGYSVVFDYIGDSLGVGFTWNHRTAGGVLLDANDPEEGYRMRWSPQGLNQNFYEVGLIDAEIIAVDPIPNPYDYYKWWLLASDSVGFRSGKVEATLVNPNYPNTYSGSETFTIAYSDMPDWAEEPWEVGDVPAHAHTVGSLTLSASFAMWEATKDVEVDLGALDFGHNGITKMIYLYSGPYSSGTSYDLVSGAIVFKLGYRCDIPLPWFSSTGNRVAPGGIIQPPP